MKRHGRIAVVYPRGSLDSEPSTNNTVVRLAEHGYEVDIYTPLSSNYVYPRFANQRVSITPVYVPHAGQKSRWRALVSEVAWLLRLRIWQAHLLSRHLRSPYVCAIGVDPHGLIAAQVITQGLKIPLAYYSLELLLSYELVTKEQEELKAQEAALSRQAAFVVTQDQKRAELLIRDNGLDPCRVICVPNAPLGQPKRQRSDYLRQKLNIPADKTVLLYPGAILAWACLHQLMQSTHAWPEDWVLVVHTQSKSGAVNQDYLEALRYLLKPGSVVFSSEPVPREEYTQLVQSADVGVAFYQAVPGPGLTEDSRRYVGLASGKLAYFLQAGIPVIVNDNPSLGPLIRKYGCGEVADDPSVTIGAIRRVLANYEACSLNALACFEKEFDFAGRFEQVLAAFEALEHRRR